MNIDSAVMKEHENKSFREIVKLPPHALQGVSEGDSKHLKEAFGIDTIEEMAKSKFFKNAMALVVLAESESDR
jgi:hypothetical protein